MSYQKITGTLNPGAHAGSYNGQDAYSDLLITDERSKCWKRTDVQHNDETDSELVGLHARSASPIGRGGCNEMETVVRRLTPTECERLQGYPDHWTDLGEWTDSKGKKHKDADSPRYKALGNSIALPFWEWMAKRMVSHLDTEHPTMASLFDGIGGFPLVYSRAGCEPVWASEIEEFPIAVTKIRFPEDDRQRNDSN